MAAALGQIHTIVLLMMENRSFDHMLGHLALDDPALPVEGIKQENVASYANNYNGSDYPLYAMPHDTPPGDGSSP